MSAIVPWTDPGGTPCCCEQSCPIPTISLPSTYRDVTLTASEYAAIVAGGTLFSERTASFSVEGIWPPAFATRSIGISGTLSVEYTHTLQNNGAGFFGSFRGPRCDQSTTKVTNIITDSKSPTYSLQAGDIFISSTPQYADPAGSQGDIFQIGVYNDGTPNQYGMWFRKQSTWQIQHIVSFRASAVSDPTNWIITMNANTNMSLAVNNAQYELIMPSRTILVPYTRSGSPIIAPVGTITSSSSSISIDRATYSPSAP